MPWPTRRRFLAHSALTAAAAAASPFIVRAGESANERINLALVGAGGRGQALATSFSLQPNVQFRYVCDVETPRAESFSRGLSKDGAAVKNVNDIRRVLDDKEVDAVIIATPEHWHALAAIQACQAEKDVYVEKNLATTIFEGQQIIAAARKYKRVVQAGFQNRSAPYAASAREYIRSGKLGKVVHVKVYNMLSGNPWKPAPDSPTPPGLDWDQWLGPAPLVPYNIQRHRNWYYWYDYCGGTFGGDASHQLDLARMVLADPPAPKAVYCAAGNYAFHSPCPTPEMMAITYEYPDFIMTCESANFPPYLRKSNNEERNGSKFPNWSMNNERIEIYGTKQMMYVGRHGVGWQAIEAEGKVVAQEKGSHPDKWHQPNFLECIRTRKAPNAEPVQAQESSCLVHLANIAHRTGNQRLLYDNQAQRFIDSDAANRFVKPTFRAPYVVPDEV